MRYLLYTILFVLCLAVGAVTFFVVAAPTGWIKDQVVEIVHRETGRRLAVNGDVSLALYPAVGVELNDVALSGPPGRLNAGLVTMERLRLDVPVLPLLQRKVAVERFNLVRPVFTLSVDKNGRNNWTFEQASLAPLLRKERFAWRPEHAVGAALSLVGTARAATQSSGGALGGLENVSLGDVRVVDGEVRYRDAASRTREDIKAINVSLALGELNGPLTGEGRFDWRGERVPFRAQVASLAGLIESRPTRLDFEATARPLAASYSGSAQLERGIALDGNVKLRSTNVRTLARWAGGATLPNASGFGRLKIDGRLAMKGDVIRFTNAAYEMGPNRGQGTITVTLDGARPHVDANLVLSNMDVDAFSDGNGKAVEGSNGATGGASEGDGIGDLLRKLDIGGASNFLGGNNFLPVAQSASGTVAGGGHREWSRAPIDLTGLGAFDANARIKAERIKAANLTFGPASVKSRLKGGVLRADFQEARLYKGRGNGVLELDARRARSRVSGRFNLANVESLPLLKDLAQFDRISGRAAVELNIKARGGSEYDFVRTLAGTGKMTFLDGAIVGINIPRTLRSIQQGQFQNLNQGDDLKTDFTELAMSFKASKGVLSSNDLRMIGPLVRLTGEGTVSLPPRKVNYLLRPKLVASLEGQGGGQGGAGLEIPVRVRGPWHKPKIAPALSEMVSNPDEAVQAARGLAEKLGKDPKLQKSIEKLTKDKNVDTLLRGLFGNQ